MKEEKTSKITTTKKKRNKAGDKERFYVQFIYFFNLTLHIKKKINKNKICVLKIKNFIYLFFNFFVCFFYLFFSFFWIYLIIIIIIISK